jgi:hypothetical protein
MAGIAIVTILRSREMMKTDRHTDTKYNECKCERLRIDRLVLLIRECSAAVLVVIQWLLISNGQRVYSRVGSEI